MNYLFITITKNEFDKNIKDVSIIGELDISINKRFVCTNVSIMDDIFDTKLDDSINNYTGMILTDNKNTLNLLKNKYFPNNEIKYINTFDFLTYVQNTNNTKENFEETILNKVITKIDSCITDTIDINTYKEDLDNASDSIDKLIHETNLLNKDCLDKADKIYFLEKKYTKLSGEYLNQSVELTKAASKIDSIQEKFDSKLLELDTYANKMETYCWTLNQEITDYKNEHKTLEESSSSNISLLESCIYDLDTQNKNNDLVLSNLTKTSTIFKSPDFDLSDDFLLIYAATSIDTKGFFKTKTGISVKILKNNSNNDGFDTLKDFSGSVKGTINESKEKLFFELMNFTSINKYKNIVLVCNFKNNFDPILKTFLETGYKFNLHILSSGNTELYTRIQNANKFVNAFNYDEEFLNSFL